MGRHAAASPRPVAPAARSPGIGPLYPGAPSQRRSPRPSPATTHASLAATAACPRRLGASFTFSFRTCASTLASHAASYCLMWRWTSRRQPRSSSSPQSSSAISGNAGCPSGSPCAASHAPWPPPCSSRMGRSLATDPSPSCPPASRPRRSTQRCPPAPRRARYRAHAAPVGATRSPSLVAPAAI